MIINASEWFENISGGRSPIFRALLDGLVPKIDLPTNETMLFVAIFLIIYDFKWLLLYVTVGLFCTVCNDIYSKTFIFGSIMTKNEQK